MFQKIILLPLLLLLFSFGCGNSTDNSSEENTEKATTESDNMAQFSEEKEFKEAHDTPDDIAYKGAGRMVKYNTPDGKIAKAYIVIKDKEKKKALFVIHEWWGLNDHIKREADRLAEELQDINVIALDLYDEKVATNREDAAKYMGMVKEERAKAIIEGAIAKAGDNADIGTIGWCFGGGWSLKASIMAGKQGKACVIYYGLPVKTAAELAPLEAPVLGIFAKNEQWISPKVVEEFEALAAATKKDLTVHSFDADHAFANPSSDKYVEKAATEANKLAVEFLKENL